MNFYSSKEWKSIRKIILDEDKKCAICNREDTLDVHHKTLLKEGGTNTRENLITLCSSHHHKIHVLDNFYRNQYAVKSFNRLFKEVLLKHLQ